MPNLSFCYHPNDDRELEGAVLLSKVKRRLDLNFDLLLVGPYEPERHQGDERKPTKLE